MPDSKWLDEDGKLNEVYFKEILYAAKSGQVDVVEQMLDGVDIQQVSQYKYRNGNTLLIDTAYSGKEEILDLLIKKNVDVNIKSNMGQTALGAYISYGDYESIAKSNRINRKLLNAGAVDETGEYTKSDLACAIEENNLETVQNLLNNNVDVNADNKEGNPIWKNAINKPQILYALAKAGANFDVPDKEGKTALMDVLSYRDNKDSINILLDSNVNVNAKDNKNYTALHLAEDAEVVQRLVDKEADVNAETSDGYTPIWGKNADCMRILYNAGAKIDVKHDGLTLMSTAANNQNLEAIMFLQEQGLDINSVDDYGWSPLKYAAASKTNVNIKLQSGKRYIKTCEPNAEFVHKMTNLGAKVYGSDALSVIGEKEEDNEIRTILEEALENEKKQLQETIMNDSNKAKLLQDQIGYKEEKPEQQAQVTYPKKLPEKSRSL